MCIALGLKPLQMLPCAFGQQFGLRTRNEHGGIDRKIQSAKAGADDMLEGLPFGAALHHRSQRGELRIRQGALKIEIKLQARKLEQVRKHQLDLQTGRFDAFTGQKLTAFLNYFQNGHCGDVTTEGPVLEIVVGGASLGSLFALVEGVAAT